MPLSKIEPVAHSNGGAEFGSRNFIINGAARFTQRGDYSTAVSAVQDTYYIDRFRTAISGVSGNFQHVNATLPDGRVVKAMRIVATTAGTGYMGFRTTLENYWDLSGRNITLSAWVRTNHASVGFRHDSTIDVPVKFTGDGVWRKVYRNYTCPSIITAGRDSNQTTFACLAYNNNAVSVAVGDYIEMTEWQIELGYTASPFEYRPHGTELALCQRYCQAIRGGGNSRYFLAGNYSGGNAYPSMFLRQQMRVAPAITVSSPSHFIFETFASAQQVPTAISLNAANADSVCVQVTVPSALANGGHLFGVNAGAYILFESEL